jgi:hypothetical protein
MLLTATSALGLKAAGSNPGLDAAFTELEWSGGKIRYRDSMRAR